LLPTPIVNQVFEYVLARCANRTGILVHAWLVMSNHYHLIVTDPEGRLPEFQQDMNSLIARILNRHWGHEDTFWGPGSYNEVEPLTESAFLEKMAYTLANPVLEGLVQKASEWKGASSVDLEFGQVRRIERPGFLRGGEAIETLYLSPPPPQIGSAEASHLQVHELVHEHERMMEAKFAQKGGRVMGMKRVLAQSWKSAPTTSKPRGGLRPRFAGRDAAIMARAVAEWKDWIAAYRRALKSFREKVSDVIFPAGTYWMRIFYRVEVVGA
jgi:putative transposase